MSCGSCYSSSTTKCTKAMRLLGRVLGLGLGGSGLWGHPPLSPSPQLTTTPIIVPPEREGGGELPGRGLGSSTNPTPDFEISCPIPHLATSGPSKVSLEKRRLELTCVELCLAKSQREPRRDYLPIMQTWELRLRGVRWPCSDASTSEPAGS